MHLGRTLSSATLGMFQHWKRKFIPHWFDHLCICGNMYSSVLSHTVGKTKWIFPPCRLCLGHKISNTDYSLNVSEWPGSLLSCSWCCVPETPLPSSCQTPRNSGNSWAATRRKQTGTAPATQLAAGLDERSSGLTVRRSSSCTTSWGATSTPRPQTWSTWWD